MKPELIEMMENYDAFYDGGENITPKMETAYELLRGSKYALQSDIPIILDLIHDYKRNYGDIMERALEGVDWQQIYDRLLQSV
jgi:hypothetical protein